LAALEDDLNTPKAVAELFELVREVNRGTDEGKRRVHAEALRAGGWILGILQHDPVAWFEAAPAGDGQLEEPEIEALLENRERLRRARKFAEADAIRDELAARGIVIEDVTGGSRWRRI
jgi:cysteinyl-tRNA synthetase